LNNRNGFLLIELLIAGLLFIIALSAFTLLLKTGAKSIEALSHCQAARQTITAKMEALHILPFNQLAAENGKTFSDGKGEITAIPVTNDLFQLSIKLKWDSSKPPLEVQTLRSAY
jgi:Tfp pilus assembly protein PilV